MKQTDETRRRFLRNAFTTAAALPLLASCRSRTFAVEAKPDVLTLIKRNANTDPSVNWTGAIDAPDNVSWKTVLSKKSDKDEPTIISGTVFQADGTTPAPNILIYFYHTDSEGYYGRGNGEVRHGHFRGWMLTDKQGKYSFRTIKPAPYPENKWAAHIHMTVTGLMHKENSIDSILFEGDRLISSQERSLAGSKGGFNPIVKLEKSTGGILHGVRDIQLWQV